MNGLSELEEFIEDLKPSKRISINSSQLFNFNQPQLTKLLLSEIKTFQSQNTLIDTRGVIDLNTKSVSNYKNKLILPQHFASFFIEKLYICGGLNSTGEIASLISIDSLEQISTLADMGSKRRSLSLSGVDQQLVAIGGYKQKFLAIVQSYNTSQDKWKYLPNLNIPRMNSGSCVLSSGASFCFAGFGDNIGNLNSLERLLPNAQAWTLVKVPITISKFRSLAVAQFQNKMILFGGIHKPLMLEFSLVGVFLKDNRDLPGIPKQMGQGSFTVNKDRLFVSSGDPFKKWRVQVYNGENWSPL